MKVSKKGLRNTIILILVVEIVMAVFRPSIPYLAYQVVSKALYATLVVLIIWFAKKILTKKEEVYYEEIK